MTGERAMEVLLPQLLPKSYVLDIGAGDGRHVKVFAAAGHVAHGVDMRPPPFRGVGWTTGLFPGVSKTLPRFDVVWCSHVLEHLPDTGAALAAMRSLLLPDGLLAVTVPPMKTAVVGGHVSLFTLGLLAYRLISVGFDCRGGSFGSYGYNLSAIVSRSQSVPPGVLGSLRHDNGDIETLAKYFPASWAVTHGFDGAAVPNSGLFAER